MELKDVPTRIKVSVLAGLTILIAFIVFVVLFSVGGRCVVCRDGVFESLLPLNLFWMVVAGFWMGVAIFLTTSLIVLMLALLVKKLTRTVNHR